MATDVFHVVHMNLLGFTLVSRTNFCDADAGGYLGQEVTEVGLFKGVTYTARVWRRCLKETISSSPEELGTY